MQLAATESRRWKEGREESSIHHWHGAAEWTHMAGTSNFLWSRPEKERLPLHKEMPKVKKHIADIKLKLFFILCFLLVIRKLSGKYQFEAEFITLSDLQHVKWIISRANYTGKDSNGHSFFFLFIYGYLYTDYLSVHWQLSDNMLT